jgi:hypothetical protein
VKAKRRARAPKLASRRLTSSPVKITSMCWWRLRLRGDPRRIAPYRPGQDDLPGIGSASPSIQQKVKDDYERFKYIFSVNPINSAKQAAGLVDFMRGKLKGELGYTKISIIGENAKWVQDVCRPSKRARPMPASKCQSRNSSTYKPSNLSHLDEA